MIWNISIPEYEIESVKTLVIPVMMRELRDTWTNITKMVTTLVMEVMDMVAPFKELYL